MSRGKDRGQAVAELAILLPLLALILLGCLDLGRVFAVWLTLSNATREGARYVASNPSATIPDIEAETRFDIEQQGLPPGEVDIDVDPPDPLARKGGDPVTVTARYPMVLATTYLFGGQPITIHAQTQMAVMPPEGK